MSDQISEHHGPVKLTHKMNHHTLLAPGHIETAARQIWSGIVLCQALAFIFTWDGNRISFVFHFQNPPQFLLFLLSMVKIPKACFHYVKEEGWSLKPTMVWLHPQSFLKDTQNLSFLFLCVFNKSHFFKWYFYNRGILLLRQIESKSFQKALINSENYDAPWCRRTEKLEET